MYELIRNIKFIRKKKNEDKSCVMATIIRTEGSSYRKKWTQMVVASDMSYEGALSGGCVEREVLRQASKLFFNKGVSVFEYDGTENLGCKGRIWVALEYIHESHIDQLIQLVEQAHKDRKSIVQGLMADDSRIYYRYKGQVVSLSPLGKEITDHDYRFILPQNRLVIVGGEFDSFILARMAQWSGWDTHLIVYKDYVKPNYKPEYHIRKVIAEDIEQAIGWDDRTALILMTHSIHRDYTYLIRLLKYNLGYLGALGPLNRSEELKEKCKTEMDTSDSIILENLNKLKGPVGINIKAATPEEIGISILAELIQVFREQ
jgi:xanthine/CO dehydrogenase XdhC/CoxF family maturation factor